jgi:hypothetical protein
MATRMQQRRGTAAQWISTNGGNGPILNAGEIGYETDTNKFKIGDGTNHWINLDYFIDANSTANPSFGSSITFEGATANAFETTLNVIDPTEDRAITLPNSSGTVVLADSGSGNVTISGDLTVSGTTTIINSTVLEVQNEIKFEGATGNSFETSLKVVDPTADRDITFPDASGTVALLNATQTFDNKSINLNGNTVVGTLAEFNTALSDADFTTLAGAETLTNKTLTSPKINEDVAVTATATEINVLDGITSSTAELNILDGVTATAAQINVLASLTSSATELNILDGATLSTAELNYVDGVTSAIQTQLDAKQAVVANVSDTEIGYLDGVTSAIQTQLNGKQATVLNVSDVEIGYLDGVTSSIQTQLDAKSTNSKTETLTNKTLTSPVINTPTGITKSDVGLGNVDNTADSNKPVSTATQTALDLKLALAGGTMTGALTLSADPSSSLHAATKQYVDNTASGVIAKPQVLGATTANIDATYNNGTAGVGATLTHNTNGAFPAEAGGASGWAVGKGILVKNQTNKAQNGRYYVSNMGSVSTPYVLTRCTYCDEASEIPGAYIFVQDGTFAGTGWIQVVADPATFVVGTDNIDVFQFSGSGTITAGTNISVSGNEISVVATPSLSGVAFTDGTQTKEAVPSRTPIIQKTDSYTLSSLTERDSLIEVAKASATTITIPLNSAVAYPVGTSIDILQTSTGQVTIAGDAGVTVNATPGLKLRTQWSTATLFKRATNTWVVYGDLTA